MTEGPTPRQSQLIEIEKALGEMDFASMRCWLVICQHLQTVRGEHLCGEARADFKTWVADMRLKSAWANSYSWACRAADVWQFFVMEMEKPKEELAQVGKAKLVKLIPLARNNDVSDELWAMALDENVTVHDLADHLRELRGEPPKPEPKMLEVCCEHCGSRFLVAIPERRPSSLALKPNA